jgi:hypothetical protein
VLDGLVPVVIAIVGVLLASDLAIFRSNEQPLPTQLTRGLLGLLLGSVVFHVVVVLFGAPVVEYVTESSWSLARRTELLYCCYCSFSLWKQTLLLAVLLSSCTTMPLALHLGFAPRRWLDLLLELRSISSEGSLLL